MASTRNGSDECLTGKTPFRWLPVAGTPGKGAARSTVQALSSKRRPEPRGLGPRAAAASFVLAAGCPTPTHPATVAAHAAAAAGAGVRRAASHDRATTYIIGELSSTALVSRYSSAWLEGSVMVAAAARCWGPKRSEAPSSAVPRSLVFVCNSLRRRSIRYSDILEIASRETCLIAPGARRPARYYIKPQPVGAAAFTIVRLTAQIPSDLATSRSKLSPRR
jgi:hypothetical protein